MTGYTLFGSEMSYFSGKARAYLRWKGISFTEIAPTPQVMKDEIIANIGWPVIPVLKTPKGEGMILTPLTLALLSLSLSLKLSTGQWKQLKRKFIAS